MEVGFLADIVIATCLIVVVTYTTAYVGECKNNVMWLGRSLSKWLSSQDWYLGTVNPFDVCYIFGQWVYKNKQKSCKNI